MRVLTYNFDNLSNVRRNVKIKQFEKLNLKFEKCVWGASPLKHTFHASIWTSQNVSFHRFLWTFDMLSKLYVKTLIFKRDVSLQDSTVFASCYAFLWNSVQILNFLKFQHFLKILVFFKFSTSKSLWFSWLQKSLNNCQIGVNQNMKV